MALLQNANLITPETIKHVAPSERQTVRCDTTNKEHTPDDCFATH